MELKRVVVTGMGAITPLGNTAEETWQNIVDGKSGAAPITLFDASTHKTQFACEVKNFQPELYIDKKDARKMDRYCQLAVSAATMAIADSNMDLEAEDKNRIGVVLGIGIGGMNTFQEEVSNYALTHEQMGPRFTPMFVPKMIADIAAGHISIKYGFHGPNYITSSACASSTNALADAFNLIRLGKANAIISGGSEAAILACGVGGFNAMKALSTRNDDPEHASRPFSASRDGFVMGEGSSILVLEELEHAKARGAKIYAEMVGAGMSADAHHITASHPEGLGAILVMQMWGIFRYADEVKITSIPSNSDASVDENTNDDPTNGIYFIGDYGNYYMKMPMRSNAEDVAYVNGVIDKMKSYEKKAPNLLFINDVAKDIAIRDDADVLKYDPSLAGQTVKYYLDNGFGGTQGDFGMFTDFGNDEITSQSTCTISGTTVTVTGDALVGLKIYDNSGNLIYVSNEREFKVSSAVANEINNGKYTLIGVSGDGYELNMLDPDYEVRSIGDITRFIRRMMNGDTQITVTKVGKMANRVLQKK